MVKKKDKNKKFDHGDKKLIRKEVFNILFVMLVFGGLFMMFMSFKGSPIIIKSELYALGLFIIWGMFIAINKNTKARHFYLFKGVAWFNISLTCLMFSTGTLYFHMGIQSVIIYILIIASYLGMLCYVIFSIKTDSMKNIQNNDNNKNRSINLAVSFASFGYVLFYVISKHLSQNVLQIIMISGLLYFALDFISIGAYFTNEGIKE